MGRKTRLGPGTLTAGTPATIDASQHFATFVILEVKTPLWTDLLGYFCLAGRWLHQQNLSSMPLSAPPLRCLLLWDDRFTSRDGASNMAVDEALILARLAPRAPVLRVYRWDRPTLSFGYFIPWQEAAAACLPGESLIRRWTGGGLVHHAGAFTWSLVVPASDPFSQVRAAESYVRLHKALAQALGTTGLGGLQIVPAASAAPSGGLCSHTAAPGDLLYRGKKIAGAGQRRTRAGLLHQGVIFRSESSLPEDFPLRLAKALAEDVLIGDPAWVAPWPLARYADPCWNRRC